MSTLTTLNYEPKTFRDVAALLDFARHCVDGLLPDPTVIDASEDAREAAVEMVRFAESESRRLGETLYRVDADELAAFRDALIDAIVDVIISSRTVAS